MHRKHARARRLHPMTCPTHAWLQRARTQTVTRVPLTLISRQPCANGGASTWKVRSTNRRAKAERPLRASPTTRTRIADGGVIGRAGCVARPDFAVHGTRQARQKVARARRAQVPACQRRWHAHNQHQAAAATTAQHTRADALVEAWQPIAPAHSTPPPYAPHGSLHSPRQRAAGRCDDMQSSSAVLQPTTHACQI